MLITVQSSQILEKAKPAFHRPVKQNSLGNIYSTLEKNWKRSFIEEGE